MSLCFAAMKGNTFYMQQMLHVTFVEWKLRQILCLVMLHTTFVAKWWVIVNSLRWHTIIINSQILWINLKIKWWDDSVVMIYFVAREL